MDFGSLQHMKVRKSTSRGVSSSRYVPSSGFGYPLDGLLLPSPCRVCFAPTALLGFTLRSFPLSKGIRDVTARKHPHAVFPAGIAVTRVTTLPGKPRLLGFHPFESPLRSGVCLAHRVAGCSPGFLPFQGILARALSRDFSRSPLTRFSRPLPEGKAGRRLRVSIGSRWASSTSGGESNRGRDSPHRVFAPVRS
jgi:hypothetical protein